MTDSSLSPISNGTGENTSSNLESSDSSAQPHGASESEMNESRKVANTTHRGMKSRHLTMIGTYSCCSDRQCQSFKPSFAQL
jgi:amino acid permease